MHLRDYLHDIPLKALKTIAETLGIDVEYRARIKLMNAIDRAFWDYTLIDRIIDRLSPLHRRVLAIIAFSYNAGVIEQALVKKMERLDDLNRRQILDVVNDLIPSALVGGIRGTEGVYFCPEGLAGYVRERFIAETFAPNDQPGLVPSFTQPNLLEDIYSFLAAVYKENLPLTLLGKIRKTVLDRVFAGSASVGTEAGLLTIEKRDSFVVDYCAERGLVEIGRHDVTISKKLKGWLELTTTDRINDIVSFAINGRFQESATVITLFSLFAELDSRTVFDAPGLAAFLDTSTTTAGGIRRLEPRIKELLAILTQLGLLSCHNGRFAVHETGARFFRGEKLPQDEHPGAHFVIQPNFEVICGPEFPPRLRFMLELLAERKSRDTVLTFMVTQQGIARARERDMSTDDIIRFFHDHSRTQLPQNVRFSIESWANSYGTIFFETVTVMRCRTPEICDSIVHSPAVAPYIMEQLSDTALVVSVKHIQAIMEQLRKAGYQPEAFGGSEPDSMLNGSGFTPISLAKLVAEHALPAIHQNFIFPDRLLEKGDET